MFLMEVDDELATTGILHEREICGLWASRFRPSDHESHFIEAPRRVEALPPENTISVLLHRSARLTKYICRASLIMSLSSSEKRTVETI